MWIKVKNIWVLQNLISSTTFYFFNINNITQSNHESVLEKIKLLTVKQLLLYFNI